MTAGNMFLRVAKDEAETLVQYQDMLDSIEDISEEEKAIMDEVMGDEFNHCLIALLSAAKLLGIKISTDELSENPNDIEVTE